jgi:hypothetical protein
MDEVRHFIAADPALSTNLALHRSITGFAEVSATILLVELPNIAEFTPKTLAAFVGRSPSEHSSRHLRMPIRKNQPHRNGTPAQQALDVCPQRQMDQQATCCLRHAHGGRRQATQSHSPRRGP